MLFTGRARVAALEARCAELERQTAELSKSSQTKLRVDVDDLRAVIEQMAASHRRELGKVWGRIGAAPELHQHEAADDELQAFLNLQKG